jgi:hypothetical protein
MKTVAASTTLGMFAIGVVLLAAMDSPVAAQTPQRQQVGDYRVVFKKDVMSDEDRTWAYTLGVSNTKTSFGVRCMEDGLNVEFMYDKYLMGRDSAIPVQYRFPAQSAVSQVWDISTDHEAAYMPVRLVSAFLAAASREPTITLRVTDHDGDTVTSTFSLDGFSDAVALLPCAKSRVRK